MNEAVFVDADDNGYDEQSNLIATNVTVTREGIQVKVGQVWGDLDKRMGGRERMVVAIEGDRAVMGFPWEPGRLAGRTKVLINRMHTTSQGWALLRDVE